MNITTYKEKLNIFSYVVVSTSLWCYVFFLNKCEKHWFNKEPMRWASQLLIPVCRQHFSKDQMHPHFPLVAFFPVFFPPFLSSSFYLKLSVVSLCQSSHYRKKRLWRYVACLSLALQRNAASHDIFTCHVLITVHEEQRA